MAVSVRQDFLLQWHLTRRCNLRCAHCYDSAGRSGTADEMSTAECLDAAGEVAETIQAWSEAYGLEFSPEASLTGGEPLLRPDLFDIASALATLGFSVSVLTNGTLADDRTARRLTDAGVRSVQVSLEGPEPLHDAIRGHGSFSAATAGVRALAEAGLAVTVNMTLTRLNGPSLARMADIAAGLGATRLGFSRLVPEGRGKELQGIALTTDEVASLYRRTAAHQPAGIELVTSDPLAAQLLQPAPDNLPDDLPVGGCSAGVSGITLMPDGTLMPCRRLDLPIGNLRQDSLREIWAASPVLEALRTRSRYGGPCGSCRLWPACRGCRAVARAVTGDFLAGDPDCFLFQKR